MVQRRARASASSRTAAIELSRMYVPPC